MIKVFFYMPNNTVIAAEGFLGENLMALAKRYNIREIRGACGGNLSCASCHLLIKSKNILQTRSDEEEDMLYTLAEPYPLNNSRLSCQITLTKDMNNLEVQVVSI